VIPAVNSSERKAATWEFLRWLIDTKQAADWSRETGYIPVRKSAHELLVKDGFYREHPDFQTAIQELPIARESPQVMRWGAFAKIVADAMTAVVRYNSPALETLKGAEREVDILLKSNARPEP
jgi:ABC-type glycerol-3-phosphate transport system substrate-binding protein